MPSFYTTLILYALLAEFLRRCYGVLARALTGPLSQIPGPLIYKITAIPWTINGLRGNAQTAALALLKKYGDVVCVMPGTVLISSKEGIQKIIYEEDFRKGYNYEDIREHRDIASLFTETDKVAHRQKRRLLSSGFSISYINGLEPLMQSCIQDAEDVLNAKCAEGHGSTSVDIARMMNNLAADVISATAFGGSFNLVKTNDTRLKDLITKRLRRVSIDATFPFLKHLPFVPAPNREINEIADEIIEKRRTGVTPARRDLVQIYLDAHEANPMSFTQNHIREEMMLFMVAGSDTSASTLTFTIFLLVKHPEKLKTLTAELDAAFPSKDQAIKFSDTQDLPYLNAVIDESMRVMPIIMGLPRVATCDFFASGYLIPAGTAVAAITSALMVDPRYWPDAESFVPERWLGPYQGAEPDRKAYLPFSMGSRNCIGKHFAWTEMRLVLATLLRRFELSDIPGQSSETCSYTVCSFKQGCYNVGVKPRG